MENINVEVKQVSDILDRFVESRKIVKEDVDRVFRIVRQRILERQARAISDGRLSFEGRRVIFGALRTINIVLDSMHISLLRAIQIGENPTTAERCLEVVPFMTDITSEISRYNPHTDRNGEKLEHIFDSSRLLRKKAAIAGFSKSIDQQFNELRIKPKEIEEFIESLNETIQNRLEAM